MTHDALCGQDGAGGCTCTAESRRVVLVHLSVEVPAADQRDADGIADAVLAALEVGHDDETVYYLTWTVPMAEEV